MHVPPFSHAGLHTTWLVGLAVVGRAVGGGGGGGLVGAGVGVRVGAVVAAVGADVTATVLQSAPLYAAVHTQNPEPSRPPDV